ncbi:Chromate transporter [Metarhizium rileyi]|uniref:Chromate transporter n=1 Tax=Metarhizium rileyi (strain RCEF 4871) TaxID=1649241 RepID=A0A167HF74_METRR|nr:Chromate transporter [Metarhizium rileyi RCEF 4871]
MAVHHRGHRLRRDICRAWETTRSNWHLGFTAFGGPPFHDRFVLKLGWIDEQLYRELFSISQALCGPASTKMLYCINLIHGGLFAAILALLAWSLPGALGMFGLSIGASSIGDTLPGSVYALLSGLNAATVGIIALAAVEISHKAVTDQLSRTLVFLAAAAGMLYNALWYFPLLMMLCGSATVIHDSRWLNRPARAFKSYLKRLRRAATTTGRTASEDESIPVEDCNTLAEDPEPRAIPSEYRLDFSWKPGAAIITSFFLTFIVVMVLRGVLRSPPMKFKLFANLYLAGTIIFGGGPVVIPLLREYVVVEGWVSPRDFLIGLAITQAFPGPNFNFAVFLGGLAALNNGYSPVEGAILGLFGIFLPGIILVHGTMGVWSALRSKPWVKSGLRGVNAGAVGLIYTAVYRIWQVGYIDEGFQSGKSLGDDPWWVVVSATAYIGGRHFGVPAALAIMLGAVLGLVRYGVVSAQH